MQWPSTHKGVTYNFGGLEMAYSHHFVLWELDIQTVIKFVPTQTWEERLIRHKLLFFSFFLFFLFLFFLLFLMTKSFFELFDDIVILWVVSWQYHFFLRYFLYITGLHVAIWKEKILHDSKPWYILLAHVLRVLNGWELKNHPMMLTPHTARLICYEDLFLNQCLDSEHK